MERFQAKRLVADAGRRLLAEGLAARTWGNISCRTSDMQCEITPSGLGYDRMTADDVVTLCITDGTWSGARKPSSERGVHIAAYRRFSDVNFVIHTHQDYATALGLAGWEQLALTAETRSQLGGLARAAYGLPGTKTLTDNVDRAMASGAHTVLMAHHGALIAGRDAEEAFARASLLEAVCKAACKGQSETEAGNTALLFRLTECARDLFSKAGCTEVPAVLAASRLEEPIHAQLDDMAQMIGSELVCAPEKAVLDALKSSAAVLIPGAGAICRAETEEDVTALCRLTEKACIAYLHTRTLGISALLSPEDVSAMRTMYLESYSKQIGG